jgi:hypothetical protein
MVDQKTGYPRLVYQQITQSGKNAVYNAYQKPGTVILNNSYPIEWNSSKVAFK